MYKKISVIIPVYNIKKYLERCVNSIVTQSYTNIEIILVDDGSSDGSSELCDQLAKRDSRIQVIHQKNQGASVARNVGISYATGEYFLFVDSDDRISGDLCLKAIQKMKEHDVDAVYWGNYCTSKEEVIGIDYPKLGEGLIEREEICTKWLKGIMGYSFQDLKRWFEGGKLSENNDFPCIWRFLYKGDVIRKNNIRFIPGILSGQDALFNFYFLLYCKKMYVMKEPLYYYESNENSLYRTVFKRKDIVKHRILLNDEKDKFSRIAQEKGVKKVYDFWEGTVVLLSVQLLILASRRIDDFQEYRNFMKREYVKQALKKLSLKKAPIKYKIVLMLVKYHCWGVIYFAGFILQKVGIDIYPYEL